jgi:OOP family OmpA-OmpF porin
MNSRYRQRLVAISVVMAGFGGAAAAADTTDNPGYLFDRWGDVVVNDYGECWRTRWWEPKYAIEKCDPEYFVKAEPEPVAVPVPVVERFALDADTYFDFNGETLRPEGREKLRDGIRRIRGFQRVEHITITGHTDPIGSDAYNQALSQRRAASVRDYLVEQGIDANRITAQGVGEYQPVATCPGKRGRRLIECLQPNRRVEIEISGVKAMAR